MSDSIQSEYEQRHAAAQTTYAIALVKARRLLYLVIGALVLMMAVGIKAFYGWLPWWWALAPLLVVAGVEPLRYRAVHAWTRAMRLVHHYEDGLVRVDGSQAQTGHTGEGFAREGHLFASDLSVLGRDSLFGMLATTRTAVGQHALADFLLDGASAEEARSRQAAVRELSTRLDLRERVALLGRSAFEQVPAESFLRWVARGRDAEDWARGRILGLRILFAAIVVSWVGCAAWAMLHGSSAASAWRNAAALLAVQAALSMGLRNRVMSELAAVERLAGQSAILHEGLRVLRREEFRSARLRALQEEAAGEEKRLAGLERILVLAEQRTKEWYYLVAMLFATGTQTALALMQWRQKYGAELRQWVAAWAQFEALLALGGYAQEHPENAWPKVVEGGAAVFVAEGLRHPLLGLDAVANDVSLTESTKFLLISGSNMAGKSTLLRAMGANAVLALAGAPVSARSVQMTAMRLGASIAVGDSLSEGRSKFLAEAERLRDLLQMAREGPMLFLVDEIFSGTNSADRKIAAEAVLRGLTEAGAIGALSTHDLALTEIEALGGVNVHMASPDADDPLRFDYLLKPGVNTTTNGLAIVRMLGIVRES